MRALTRVCFCLVAAVLGGCGAAQDPARPASGRSADPPPAAELPATPAGKKLAGWLAALNTGQREPIRRFVADHFEPPPGGPLPVDGITDGFLALAKQTGGLDVRRVVGGDPVSVTSLAQARRTGGWVELKGFVAAEPPRFVTPAPSGKMNGLGLEPVECPPDLLPNTRLTDAEVAARLDALVSDWAKADDFSGVVLLAKDGVPVFSKAVGQASRAWAAPNRPDTRFNLASINKAFTAVAVARLVADGKLSYQDTLGKLLPDYPNATAKAVTVHHLLTHTSGMADLPRDELLAAYHRGARTVADFLPAVAAVPLKGKPGERFDYSNAGYLVLGAVVEKVAGQPYHAHVREKVFRPAGMAATDLDELDADPAGVATGYMDAPGGRRSNVFHLGVRGTPFGGAYAPAGDLVKFAEALRSGKLLPAEAVNRLWAGQANGGRYGYGFEVREHGKVRVVGHGGGWFGVTNRLDHYPGLGYTLVVLSNYDADTTGVIPQLPLKVREWLAAGAG